MRVVGLVAPIDPVAAVHDSKVVSVTQERLTRLVGFQKGPIECVLGRQMLVEPRQHLIVGRIVQRLEEDRLPAQGIDGRASRRSRNEIGGLPPRSDR